MDNKLVTFIHIYYKYIIKLKISKLLNKKIFFNDSYSIKNILTTNIVYYYKVIPILIQFPKVF
ncbi:hypothetical protein BN1097_630024 [Clostridioides difficile]|uniref:Uncharacterized protein n=1 Tax=Clostridioides difficile TaxID=1496 RepID=A0A069AFW0_CLODI|nr:hypothetical protein BN1097_630024 [Clostridioides difficile]